MTDKGQITKEDQEKQATVGDLLQKPFMTAKEQQQLAELTTPTDHLKANGIYTNGEEPDDFKDTQARLEPAIGESRGSQETTSTEQLNAAPPPLQSATDPSENPIADAELKHPIGNIAPKSANDSRKQTKAAPTKKAAAKKAEVKS